MHFTEGFMMDPDAIVSALVFNRIDSSYFSMDGAGTGWHGTSLLQLKNDLTHLSKPPALRHPLVGQGEIYKKDSAEEYRTFKHMNQRDKIRESTIAENRE